MTMGAPNTAVTELMLTSVGAPIVIYMMIHRKAG